jgi:hypothetical protein
MLIAETGGFWKVPNVFDVAGIVGVVLGVASIWVSWWLAKRDIQKRLTAAADQASAAARSEIRRVAQAVLQTGLADTVRSLELAREACRGKLWPRAGELCELAREQLARVLAQPAAVEATQAELQGVSAVLLDCVARLRRQPRSGTGGVPDEVRRGLDDAIIALRRVEGRMTGIRLEADHG